MRNFALYAKTMKKRGRVGWTQMQVAADAAREYGIKMQIVDEDENGQWICLYESICWVLIDLVSTHGAQVHPEFICTNDLIAWSETATNIVLQRNTRRSDPI